MKLFKNNLKFNNRKSFTPGKKEGKPFLTTQITERDKKLLAVMGLFLLILLSYMLLYKPMSSKIQTLETEKGKVDEKVAQAKNSLENEAKIQEEFSTLLKETNEKSSRFFPKVYPYKDRYIIMMENVVKASGATAPKISFAEPEAGSVPQPEDRSLALPEYPLSKLAEQINSLYETAEDLNQKKESKPAASEKKAAAKSKELPADTLLRIPATMELQGTYAQLRAAVRAMEGLNRTIAIEEVTVNEKENVLSAKLNLIFFAVEKVDNGADSFNNWTINGAYGKTDPFN